MKDSSGNRITSKVHQSGPELTSDLLSSDPVQETDGSLPFYGAATKRYCGFPRENTQDHVPRACSLLMMKEHLQFIPAITLSCSDCVGTGMVCTLEPFESSVV